ncbi:sensor histidine kinase [Sediminibacterium sp.]|uniref:sensor histidine kinase n=1 Tax=Sediminibacterium sp. TaxID=1917865 RepID=UPI0027373CA9|nr:sensor histidine kinase [Sediminibacterium sp.]MDP3394522.1 sensor histidine kinase [Sediminibacterium sp.]MDP3568357.1 sensor histidine kinase [Sediminibacterium sp.]
MLANMGYAKESIISFKGKPIVIEKEISWTKQFHQENRHFYKGTFSLISNTKTDQDLILQFSKTGRVRVVITNDSGVTQELVTGALLPLNKRSHPSNINAVQFILLKNLLYKVDIYYEPVYSIYDPRNFKLIIEPTTLFEQQDTGRLFWQGMFLGTILVMALYNLFIFYGVRDESYLYYVFSIVGLGLYLAFYYGFGIEYLWPNSPRWDTFCYSIIVPLTNIARLLFTKTYLNTSKYMPVTNRIIQLLLIACSILLVSGIVSFIYDVDLFETLVTGVGFIGTLVLIFMLVAGLIAYYKDQYEPAKYFITANALLVIGAILFILREMSLVEDNFYTRYILQIGFVIQVIIFALGLASRYNRTRVTVQLLEESKEQLSQLNSVKDKLFSIISHDLRNPLATMQSFLKLITQHHEKLNEEEKKKMIKEAQGSLDYLNELLYNVLQWSKSQMHLLEFRPEKLQAKTALEKNIRLLYLQAHMKQVQIEQSISDDHIIYADKEMLDFIIRNLLSNAIKFSHKHSVIQINTEQKEQHILIHVIDEGVGMSSQTIEQLQKASLSNSRRGTAKERGTGLGLLICKEFIAKHKGELLISQGNQKGSQFTVLLPNETT